MRHYKASNGRIIKRGSGGRFRRTTMQDFGIAKEEISTEKEICQGCQYEWNPILKRGYCPKCGLQCNQAETP